MAKYYYEKYYYGKKWTSRYNGEENFLEEIWTSKNRKEKSAFSNQFINVSDLYMYNTPYFFHYPNVDGGSFSTYDGHVKLYGHITSSNTGYYLYWTNSTNDPTSTDEYFEGTSESYDINTGKMEMRNVFKYNIILEKNIKIYAYNVPTNMKETVVAEDGEYPDNGIYYGYWYIKKGLVFPEIKMKINGELRTSKNGWVKIDGQLRRIDKIWTKINGVLREV